MTIADASGDAELERLESTLRESPFAETALRPDALHGMVVALAIGPDDAPRPQWLDAALGTPPGGGADASAEIVTLLTRLHDDTRRRAQQGTLAPLLYALRRGRPDYGTWCRGFLTGVELSEAGWYDAADPDEIDELMFPIHVLADELTGDERARYTPAAWRKLVLDSEAGFEDTLRRLRDYWAIVRSPPQTIRHATPRTGRNEPCPCGSGRKYKHCCGR
jgi:uncharacterized protein